jgi:hypothetical protein
MRVFVEINGVRFKSVIKRKHVAVICDACDLKGVCGTVIGSPCLHCNEVFKKVKR